MKAFRAWVEATGWSQKELAEALGVSQAHVSRILAGRRVPSDRLKVRIAEKSGGAVPASDWLPPSEVAA